jgi:hypothetical protein
MQNGDPRFSGFPAEPSIRPAICVQDIGQRGLFGAVAFRKNIYPEFPRAAGKGTGGATLPSFAPFGAVAAAGSAIVASFF